MHYNGSSENLPVLTCSAIVEGFFIAPVTSPNYGKASFFVLKIAEWICLLTFFEIRSHYVAHVGLELMILLPQTIKF